MKTTPTRGETGSRGPQKNSRQTFSNAKVANYSGNKRSGRAASQPYSSNKAKKANKMGMEDMADAPPRGNTRIGGNVQMLLGGLENIARQSEEAAERRDKQNQEAEDRRAMRAAEFQMEMEQKFFALQTQTQLQMQLMMQQHQATMNQQNIALLAQIGAALGGVVPNINNPVASIVRNNDGKVDPSPSEADPAIAEK